MLKKDAKVKFLEHQLEEREREIVSMQGAEKTFVNQEDERIYRLEQRVRDLEALVKGLTEEVLDLKTITMKLYRAYETKAAEKPRPRVMVEEQPEEKKVQPAPAPVPVQPPVKERPAVREEDEGDLDLIMQTDGTLKRERRHGSDYIIAPTRYQAPPSLIGGRKGETSRKSGRKGGDIIFAEEDDSITK
ncbi:hypothetical protein E2N92_09670 [Methanofollis formosanus]|uniref:Uncharacterized protein n=1 Tax=Methanofollis formosanus TaxID=299308 RepID=A0A8G1EH02_9EURY|nr:hypothetical protein [Methanofollis formosanus]QYZ79681.1 hypothetical protein E2N92_09670 [Methanofollis formosanus]